MRYLRVLRGYFLGVVQERLGVVCSEEVNGMYVACLLQPMWLCGMQSYPPPTPTTPSLPFGPCPLAVICIHTVARQRPEYRSNRYHRDYG